MGNRCSHGGALEAFANLATEDQIKRAVRGIEDWQRAQAAGSKGPGGPAVTASSVTLLQRMGGPDVVKAVVELFYRKIYADPRLLTFVHDQEQTHLRAKQSMFVTWLFGPPKTPYVGLRTVRAAHLKLIKQRGFCQADFDLGLKYFEDACRELGAPEPIIAEVLRRMRPFGEQTFTPDPAKDAAEEARWAAEEHTHYQQQQSHGRHDLHLGPQQQPTAEPSGETCPFSGARVSRPPSRTAAALDGAAAVLPPPLQLPSGAVPPPPPPSVPVGALPTAGGSYPAIPPPPPLRVVSRCASPALAAGGGASPRANLASASAAVGGDGSPLSASRQSRLGGSLPPPPPLMQSGSFKSTGSGGGSMRRPASGLVPPPPPPPLQTAAVKPLGGGDLLAEAEEMLGCQVSSAAV